MKIPFLPIAFFAAYWLKTHKAKNKIMFGRLAWALIRLAFGNFTQVHLA